MANRFLNNIRINDEYTLPATDGTENQIIVTDGAGNLSFNDLGTVTGAITGVESNLTYYEVKNSSGAQILKGKGVMAVGTDGNSGHILIDEMVADGSVEARYFLGVLSETLDNGEIGRVIAFGELDQFNTLGQNGETWSNGQVLWCDPDSAGDFTITEPDGPNVKIPAAFILKASTNGKIQIRVQANEAIHMLHDTKITTQADGELLVWNNTLGVWQNDGTATIDYTNGRVGIGTTSPSYKLHVEGNSYINATSASANLTLGRYSGYPTIKAGSDDGGYLIMDSSGGMVGLNWYSGDNVALVNGGGNVGIGTIGPSQKLDVAGKIRARSWFTGVDDTNTLYSSTSTGVYIQGSSYTGTGSVISFRRTDGSIKAVVNTETGNVGIGTTSPSEKLHVEGSSVISYSSTNANYFGQVNSGFGYGYIRPFNNSGLFSFDTNYTLGGGYDFAYNSTSVVRINSSGNVGIGTTSPDAKLQVNATSSGNVYFSGGSGDIRYLNFSTYDTISAHAGHKIDATSSNGEFAFAVDGSAKMYIKSSGNVGIGTASPGEKLHLKNNGDVAIALENQADASGNYWKLWQDNWNGISSFTFNINYGGTDFLTVNTSGNVGIGTNNPGEKLEVYDGSIKLYDGTRNLIVGEEGGSSYQIKSSGYLIIDATSGIQINKTTSGNVTIASGNVGIGTTGPVAKLDVYGNARFQYADSSTTLSSGGSILRLANNDTTVNNISAIDFPQSSAGSGFSRIGVIYKDRTSSSEDQDMFFRTIGGGSSSEVMRLTSSGNVGIGTTAPAYKLEVVDTSNPAINIKGGAYDKPYLRFTNSTNTSYYSQIKMDGANNQGFIIDIDPNLNSTYDYFNILKRGVSAFYIDRDDQVGIGTTSPSSKLQVEGSAFLNSGILKITNNSITNYYDSNQMNSYGTSYDWKFSGANVMRINSSGNVGIGTTSPSYKLDVNGGASIALRLNTTSDAQLLLNSSDSWTGIGFSDANSPSTDFIWHNGQNQTFALGGGGSNVSGKKLHVHGAATIGSGLAAAAVPTNGLIVEGNVGIGTTNPGGVFDIQNASSGNILARVWNTNTSGTGSSSLRIANSGNNNNGSRLEFSDISYYVATISGDRTQGLVFRTSANGTSPTGISEQMRITPTGNVGIGTTSPASKLHVAQSTGTVNELYITQQKTYGSGTGTSERAAIVLGISESGIAFSDRKFAVIETGSESESTSANSFLAISTRVGGGINERMRITSGGNVGIGTTSPDKKLTVSQSGDSSGLRIYGYDDKSTSFVDLYVDSAGNTRFTQSNPGTSGYLQINAQTYLSLDAPGLVYTSSNFRIYDSGLLSIGSGGDYKLKYDNVSDVLNIHTDDNKGITISNTGLLKFTEYGSGTVTGTATQRLAVDSSGNVIEIPIGSGPVDGSGTANTVTMWSDTDTITNAPITISGNNSTFTGDGRFDGSYLAVGHGIGSSEVALTLGQARTASGYAYIDFVGDTTYTDYGLRIIRGNSGANTTSQINHRGTGPLGIRTVDAANITFDTAGSERARITSAGNVGIGTTSPAYKLDVSGEGRFTGTLFSNGILRGSSLQTGAVSVAPPRIDSFYMQPAPETSTMMAHPYFMSDLAAFVKRGGTVTVTGLTTPPSNHDALFRADAAIWSTAASNYTGSTFTFELSDVDSVQQMRYGVYCGIQFGNSGWAPASLKIEWSTDDGVNWTTALDSSAKSDFYYTRLLNGATAITNIKFTIGQPSSSLRILNIFATDYAGRGSELYHLSTSGGTVWGDVTISGSSLTVGNDLIVSGGDITLFGTGRIQGIDSVIDNTDAVNKYYVDNAVSGLVDGSGTANYVTKWSDADTITNSVIYDDGTNVGIGTTSPTRPLSVHRSTAGSVANFLHYTDATAFTGLYINVDNANNIVELNASGDTSSTMAFQTGNAERMRIASGGNVGIGTTSPGAKLHVLGSIYANAGSIFIDSGQRLKWGNSNQWIEGTNDTSLQFSGGGGLTQMIINASGNVGIGTTSPNSTLEVNGDITIKNANGTNPTDAGSLYFRESGNTWGTDYYGFRINQQGTSNYLNFQSANLTTVTDILTLARDTGNVGIGTTSPNYKLHVIGDASVSTWLYVNNIYPTSSTNDLLLNTGAGRTITLDPTSTGKTVIPNGNVGIGITSPRAKLEIKGAGGNASGLILSNTNEIFRQYFTGDAAGSTFAMTYDGTGGNDFQIQSDGDIILADNTGGYIGIGTSIPQAKLEIKGAGALNGEIRINSSDDNTLHGIFRFIGDASTYEKYLIGYNSSHVSQANELSLKNLGGHITLHTGAAGSSSERVRVTSAGNVGIGTTSPGAKLTVAGSAISISNGWSGNHDILFVGGSPGSTGGATTTAARIRSTASAPSGAATGDLLFTVNSGDAFVDALYIKENGNVGIGTTNPTAKLHIQGTNSVNGGIKIHNSGGNPYTFWSDNDKLYISQGDGSTTAISVSYPGNVGVGTTNPRSKLDVNGGVRIADDTATASATNVGTLRYRADANNSYVDMCMQTGASTYEWINIVQNNW